MKIKRLRTLYFVLLIIVILASAACFSYAFLTNKKEEHGKLNIVVGTLDYKLESNDLENNSITVEANSMNKIEVVVTSLNDVASKYKLYYKVDKYIDTLEVQYISSSIDTPSGTIESNDTKKITIKIKNKTSESHTITFGIIGGFVNNELALNEGYSIEMLNNSCEYSVGEEFVFDYTGTVEEFSIPCDGDYQLEVWGAQGGDSTYETTTYTGGYGGYSKGNISIFKDEKLYVVVGGTGTDNDNTAGPVTETISGGYNGGGDLESYTCCTGHFPSTGGGATHIAQTTGLLEELEENKDDILIVAGGGGGAMAHIKYGDYAFVGGSGGGYIGVKGFRSEALTAPSHQAATQTSGYSFGRGGVTDYSRSTGGGGWYGGLQYSGGSGYIGNTKLTNKLMYCYDCDTSSELETLTYTTTNVLETATSEYAKMGNGYAKITYLGD